MNRIRARCRYITAEKKLNFTMDPAFIPFITYVELIAAHKRSSIDCNFRTVFLFRCRNTEEGL